MRLELPRPESIETKGGVRLMRLPAALISCAPSHFAARPIEVRAAIALSTDASEVLNRLLARPPSISISCSTQ